MKRRRITNPVQRSKGKKKKKKKGEKREKRWLLMDLW
jgi:hypothetical protein